MRTFLQNKLSEIENIEVGQIVSDDIIEKGKTYFGFEVQKNYMDSDQDKNYTYRVAIMGYVVRKIDLEENNQEIVDTATEMIMTKLKDLNFKTNCRDVTLNDNFCKMQITGFAYYNEINNGLII